MNRSLLLALGINLKECEAAGRTMTEHQDCSSCSTGCAARHTEEKTSEEISAAPYLIVSGLLIVAISILLKWIF